jgi:oligoendopeptidase F
VAEHELNSILQNKKIDDELRNYDQPDKERHIGDDIDTKIVETLINTVSKNFDLAKKYYSLKAKLFKVPKLKYHERNVEYGTIEKKYKFEDSVNIIERTFGNLDLEFSAIFKSFLENGNVDVYPKKGKKSGAFCTYGLITQPVYILLNYNNLLEDVRTFAHELGHGINNELMRKAQNSLNFGTPTSTAEVASTFMEDFVIQELTKEANEETRLNLMMTKLNQDISSIFRQVAFYNFETDLHKKFRSDGYLSEKTIGELFKKHMISYMGNAVEQSPGSQNWWVYVDHFRYYFYVYSYASGLLISKSLQAKVKADPKFIIKVKEFLSAGLSDSPKNIFSKLGIDISDPKFWQSGINEIRSLLTETEKLAKKLGKI